MKTLIDHQVMRLDRLQTTELGTRNEALVNHGKHRNVRFKIT